MQNTNERLTKSILVALRDLTSAMESLRDEQKYSVSEREVRNGEDYIPEAISAIADIRNRLDAFVKENNRESRKAEIFQRKSLRVQWWLFVATAAAFVAAFVYAYIAEGQKRTMDVTFAEVQKQTKAAAESASAARDAVTQARDQFREDRRPYIWLTRTGLGAPMFIPNLKNPRTGQVVWDWHYTNYGKTPALDIRFTHYMKVGERPYVKSNGAPSGGNFGAPLPPDKDDFSTVVSEPGITPDEFDELMAPGHLGNSVSVKVHITYTDAYRARVYETNICLSRLNGGAISYCRQGNEIK